jgi:hypothetical protein
MRWQWYVFWDRFWWFRVRVARLWCWVVGHDECWGSAYDSEPDYCRRCYVEWPQDKNTLPKYLNRWYCWMVEREWRWFAALDTWLWDHPRVLRRMPSWWEY